MHQLARARDDCGVRHARTVVRTVEIEISVEERVGRRVPSHVGSETDAVDVLQISRIAAGPVDECWREVVVDDIAIEDRACPDAGASDDHRNANATLPDPQLGRDRLLCHYAINSLAQSVGSDARNLLNEHADVTRNDKDEE